LSTLFKIVRATFFLLLLQLLSQCSGCCKEFECRYSTLLSVEVESFDNSGVSPVIPATDTIAAKAYFLALTLRGTKEECTAEVIDYLKAFQNSCYALSCPDPEFQSPDTVSSINIKCTQNFDADHPTGSDLMDLFYQRTDFVYAENWLPDDRKEFLLMKEPSNVLTCQFYVEVNLTDGRVFRDTTNTVVLNI
jgi:Domain of unknown function (DUF5034)